MNWLDMAWLGSYSYARRKLSRLPRRRFAVACKSRKLLKNFAGRGLLRGMYSELDEIRRRLGACEREIS
jgi:hypothetical protein